MNKKSNASEFSTQNIGISEMVRLASRYYSGETKPNYCPADCWDFDKGEVIKLHDDTLALFVTEEIVASFQSNPADGLMDKLPRAASFMAQAIRELERVRDGFIKTTEDVIVMEFLRYVIRRKACPSGSLLAAWCKCCLPEEVGDVEVAVSDKLDILIPEWRSEGIEIGKVEKCLEKITADLKLKMSGLETPVTTNAVETSDV